MSYAFITFCISLSGGVTAVLTMLFFSWLFSSKPETEFTVVYFARYEAGLWNVYYDDPTMEQPLRIATFTDIRDAEHLLTRVEQHAVRTPGPVDEPAVKVNEFCDARR